MEQAPYDDQPDEWDGGEAKKGAERRWNPEPYCQRNGIHRVPHEPVRSAVGHGLAGFCSNNAGSEAIGVEDRNEKQIAGGVSA